MKKQTLFVMFGVVIATLGCNLGTQIPTTQTPVDEVGTVVAATMQALTGTPNGNASTPAVTQTSGIPVSYEQVSLVIPNGLASGANTDKMTAVDTNSGAPWEIAPTHWRFTLTGYALQDKFHEAQVLIYPAAEYAQRNSIAAEQIDRLKRILVGGTPLQQTLPTVPFFNATPQIAANIKLIPFQNGNGIRFLTQYAQYAAPINNNELFYNFQGLTSDNQYYVIAILPTTAPFLAENEKPEAQVPADGVPIPTDVGPNDGYYTSITQKLNSLSPDAYTPALDALDALIQSITVTNP